LGIFYVLLCTGRGKGREATRTIQSSYSVVTGMSNSPYFVQWLHPKLNPRKGGVMVSVSHLLWKSWVETLGRLGVLVVVEIDGRRRLLSKKLKRLSIL